jgi:cytochrome P450
MVLLSTAGSDTTKQTTSHGIWALSRFPEQRAWLVDDFEARIGTAVEELVRFASPVLAFARIALRDTEVGGVRIREGEKVGMFYCSGNRDETVFTAPGELDLSRGPNPHVGFGGGGAHYCLGTNVARMQLRALFRELLLRVPDLQVGDPHWLISRHMHGIGRLPASFPKRSAVGV